MVGNVSSKRSAFIGIVSAVLRNGPYCFVLVVSVLLFTHGAFANGAERNTSRSSAVQMVALQNAQKLLDEITIWLCEHYELPATDVRPTIEFGTKAELAAMRLKELELWQQPSDNEELERITQRTVALYDTALKKIMLLEGWTGMSPAEQSILVHETVHHLQNVGKLKFECAAAREKMAFLAQDEWLSRFGKSLEGEFGIDMFTIVMSSACM